MIIVNYKEKYDNSKELLFKNIEYSLKEYYSHNPSYACEAIETINKNFDNDMGFIFAILSSKLSEIPYPYRQVFVDEYRALIQKYSKKPY